MDTDTVVAAMRSPRGASAGLLRARFSIEVLLPSEAIRRLE